MRIIRWVLGAVVFFTASACGRDHVFNVITGPTSPTFVPVTGISVTPVTFNLNIGATCTNTSQQLVVTVSPSNANQSYTIRVRNGSVGFNATGLISGIKVGVDTITVVSADTTKKATVVATVMNISCVPTPACPNGFSICTGARWSDAGMAPLDTTYTFSHKRHVRGLAFIPTGVSTEILVRSALGCEAVSGTPQVIATTVTNVYTVDVELQAINICSDSTVFKLKADSTQRKAVRVTVVSAPGSVKLNQPTTLGGVGATGNYTATSTGLADTRVWFYSTNPLVVSIVQKDTTYAVATFPWPVGANVGGKYKNLGSGSAGICAFSASNPAIADCKNHSVSTASLMAGSSLMASVELREWTVPEVLKNLTKP